MLAAAICAALAAAGRSVAPFKPVVTGLDEADPVWPPDHELLASAAGVSPDAVAPLRFGPAASPHLAAELAGTTIDPAALVAAARAAAARADVLVAEGVGGLLVPLASGYAVRDLARDLGLPLLIAARPGLGTISHTLLTLEAARSHRLDVRAVVLTPWPEEPSTVERSNRDTIAAHVEVATLPRAAGPDPHELARAAARLPLERWLTG